MKKDLKIYYKRRLPHWQPIGGVFFVTVCLREAIPKKVLKRLRGTYFSEVSNLHAEGHGLSTAKSLAHQQYLMRLYVYLSKQHSDVRYLAKAEVADIVKEQLHRFDGELYEILAYSIMPNHFHFVFDTGVQVWPKGLDFDENEYIQVTDIMKKIKGASAYYANQVLGRKGEFWQAESWDRWMRNEKELDNWIDYTLLNPVNAGLVKNWQDWPYNYWLGDF
jgi:REP element-mobilizing transposase RayT